MPNPNPNPLTTNTTNTEGKARYLEEFHRWLYKGSKKSKVEAVQFEHMVDDAGLEGIEGFAVLRGSERRWPNTVPLKFSH